MGYAACETLQSLGLLLLHWYSDGRANVEMVLPHLQSNLEHDDRYDERTPYLLLIPPYGIFCCGDPVYTVKPVFIFIALIRGLCNTCLQGT